MTTTTTTEPSAGDSTRREAAGHDRSNLDAPTGRDRATLYALIGLGLLVLMFAAVNWHWLRANAVTYGWDRMDHLITSLVYNDMVKSWSARTPFDLLSYSSYYPPLFHYGIVALYRVFGVDEDVAAMINVLYLVILLGSTWSITRRISGPWTALFAAFLLGAFPMIFAMSRYLYIDFAQTAMVALVVAALLATERFSRRSRSLWFGVALGAAFLVKWTTAAFVAAPMLYIVIRSGMLVQLVRKPGLLLPNWLRLLVCIAVSAVAYVALLWPARETVPQTWLGWWLYPILALCGAAALYALWGARPQKHVNPPAIQNAMSAAAIVVWLISFWYVINPEFADYFAFTAYGRDEPFMAFGKYFVEITTEQIGLVLSLVFLLVVLVWVWQHRNSLVKTLRSLSDTAWLLVLWVVVAYFIFSFRVTLAHARYVMPLLPPFAIWIAVGISQWRPRWLRTTAVAMVTLFAIIQFALISFDELAPWRAPFSLPVGGQTVNLLGNGFFIQYPASERTDSGYAVAPEVLKTVDDARQGAGRETVNLGLLLNSYQVHEKHFLYQIYRDFSQVRLRELARNWNDRPAYNQLFEMDYVLVGDTHTFRTTEQSQLAARRILFDQTDAFNAAFHPVRNWTLPDGEKLTLYARTFAPTNPGVATEDTLALLTLFGDRLGAGDAVVLVSPDQIYGLGMALPADAGATIVALPAAGASPAAAIPVLDELLQSHGRIFLASHNADQVDPAGEIEGWLRGHAVAGNDLWANSIRVTPFAPIGAGAPATQNIDIEWQDGAKLEQLVTYPLPDKAGPVAGGASAFALDWANVGEAPRKGSLQLLAPDGTLVAQEDHDLVAGRQDYLLLIPRSTPAGEYRLVLAVYDPNTLERTATIDGADHLELGSISIGAAPVGTDPDAVLPQLRHPEDVEQEGS